MKHYWNRDKMIESTTFNSGERLYYNTEDTDNMYPSVTTILGMIAKPSLEKWKTRQVAEYIKANYEVAVAERWKSQLIPMAMGALDFVRDNAAEIGTDAHENLLFKEADRSEFARTEPQVIASIKGWEKFTDYFSPFIVVENELPLIGESKVGKYGGTLDLLLRRGNRFILIDIKTSKSVYPEHALQVAAYTQAYNQLAGYEKVREAWIIQLYKHNDDGEFDIYKVDIPSAIKVFDSLHHVYNNLTQNLFHEMYL